MDRVRKQVSWVQDGSSLEVMVGKKHCLKLGNSRTCDPDHQLLIRISLDELGIDDVLGTRVTRRSVDNHKLSVISQIETSCVAAKKTDGKHLQNLDPLGS